MKRQDENGPLPGGHLEHALLEALWDRQEEPCTARELYDGVGRARGIVYTTVAKVLDRMVDKGLVTRRQVGRAYVYQACVSRAPTQRSIVRGALQRMLGKNPRPAVAALVGALEDVSPDLLDELAAELEAHRKRAAHGT